MNKTALMNYALSARKELESQISLSLNRLGIFKDSIKKANIVGDYTIIEGIEETYPKRVYALRQQIISEHIRPNGFDSVVEEFAYTWFNRIIALRFMEVHDYFDHGFKVLTSRDGSYEPEILQNVMYLMDTLRLDENVVHSLYAQNKYEELYRYILFKQCNQLSSILPMLFNAQESYMELLLPNNLLSSDSVIRQIELIPEEDFKNDVEVIGWLYQFYNSVKKDQVFASKTTITKETLPAVTQLFTPDWIVKYMVQNSVGRLWMDGHPNSTLASSLNFYVSESQQHENVKEQLNMLPTINDVREIKIIEPCCGSGHILVYIFDLLFDMYKESGYETKDIPGLILNNNLVGLDVDKRAAQLSQFALIMKARSVDSRFFNETRLTIPHVYEIVDSQILFKLDFKTRLSEFGFSKKSIDIIEKLAILFKNGKVIGSLLKVAPADYKSVIQEVEYISKNYIPNLLQTEFANQGLPLIQKLCTLALVLSDQYDALITNPPYCGTRNIDKEAKLYFYKEYPNSKADLYTMFMQTSLVRPEGYTAMINMHSWMFISEYQKLRNDLIHGTTLYSLLQLGAHGFDSIGGEVVQTCAFVFRNLNVKNYISSFFDLKKGKGEHEKEELFNNTSPFLTDIADFKAIDGQPFAYWVSQAVLDAYSNNQRLGDVLDVKNGMSTTDNTRFLRFWYEVDIEKISFGEANRHSAEMSGKKWFPYNKGGEYCKWFGNEGLVVNWEKDGREIRKSAEGASGGRIVSEDYYFMRSVSWSKVSPGRISFRLYPQGHLFDVAGPSIFGDEKKQLYVLALLNSSIKSSIIESIAPTVNYERGQVSSIPVIFDTKNLDEVVALSKRNVEIHQSYLADFETSWNFSKHPLISDGPELIENIYSAYKDKVLGYIAELRNNERQNNLFFANLYNLTDEVTIEPDDLDIGIRIPTESEIVKSLISYFVGILFGRYSLEREGLQLAGHVNTKFSFDSNFDNDNVLPLYQFVGIEDGLTNRICKLISEVYGEKNQLQNLDYIARGLGKKTNESSIETINRYLNDEFYQDHLKTYQRRPIYWLFSSGKQGAFRCLIYMHRYTPNTLAVINTKYFLPRTCSYNLTYLPHQDLFLETQISQHNYHNSKYLSDYFLDSLIT